MTNEMTMNVRTIAETGSDLTRDELISFAEMAGLAEDIFMPHAVGNRALKATVPEVRYDGRIPANFGLRVEVRDSNSASSAYNIDPDTRQYLKDSRPRNTTGITGKFRKVCGKCDIEGCFVHPINFRGGLCKEKHSIREYQLCSVYWSVTTARHLWKTIQAPYAEMDTDTMTPQFNTRTGHITASKRSGAGNGYKPLTYAVKREAMINGERVQWWEPVLATLMYDLNSKQMIWVWVPETDAEYYGATFSAPIYGGWA